MITEQQYHKALKQRPQNDAVIKAYEKQNKKRYAARIKNKQPFTDDELVYARDKRCKCGAGMAYPDGEHISGYWDCSDKLKGTADKKQKHTRRIQRTRANIFLERGEQTTRGGAGQSS